MSGSISADPTAVPAAASGVPVPPALALAPDGSVNNGGPPAAPPTSLRADMGRALADALGRALAGGDTRAARVALTALSGLVGDEPDGSAAPVVDLSAERERRQR